MKSLLRIAVFVVLGIGLAAVCAQQPPSAALNAPALTLGEKISLTTDEIKKQDVVEKLQKEYLAEIKPIQDHEDAARAEIEKVHPGWSLENGPQGWHLVKKPEPPKPAKAPEAKK